MSYKIITLAKVQRIVIGDDAVALPVGLGSVLWVLRPRAQTDVRVWGGVLMNGWWGGAQQGHREAALAFSQAQRNVWQEAGGAYH